MCRHGQDTKKLPTLTAQIISQDSPLALTKLFSNMARRLTLPAQIISQDSPLALTKLFSNMARRLMAAWEARMRGSKSAGQYTCLCAFVCVYTIHILYVRV